MERHIPVCSCASPGADPDRCPAHGTLGLAVWKEQYYYILGYSAAACPRNLAVQHCIHKWEGLTYQALQECGLSARHLRTLVDDHNPADPQRFSIDTSTCALCCRYFDSQAGTSRQACQRCPLSIVRNGVPCDQKADDETDSPYGHWLRTQDPEPMLRELHRARMWEENQ